MVIFDGYVYQRLTGHSGVHLLSLRYPLIDNLNQFKKNAFSNWQKKHEKKQGPTGKIDDVTN